MEIGIAIAVLCVVLGGVVAQWFAWRLRLPAIVLLFATGLILGPGLQIIQPSHVLGHMMQPLVGLCVAIIVFEGGLALDLRELRAAGEGVLRLTVIALPLNWALGSAAAHWVGGLTIGPSLLFGAIMTVTGPTVVLPLLRHTRLRKRPAAFLRWEAILNDPVGAILATLVLQVLLFRAKSGYGTLAIGAVVAKLVVSVGISAAVGFGLALGVRRLFTRDLLPETLKTPILLAFALSAYAVCNCIMEGAGLVASTVFGLALANLHVTGLGELRRFKEALVVLIVSCLFIVLTSDLDRAVLAHLSWPILGLTLAVLFVVRPVAIMVSTLFSGLSWQERVLSSWIAPRGIVAAAVAGVAGLRLEQAGYPSAQLVMPAVFAVIAATMVLHGFSLRPLARRLHLTLSDVPGLAIVGATPWTTGLSRVLNAAGVPTLLVDTYPGALGAARAAELPVLQGELISNHGSEALMERPVDYLLAATSDPMYNGLVCARLAPELGRERVFQLSPGAYRLDLHRGISREARGKVFGREDFDFELFERLWDAGWRFSVEVPDDAPEMGPDGQRHAIRLMLLRAGGMLAISSPEDLEKPPARPGDRAVMMRAVDTAVV